jgi:hypothetical protein
MTSGHRKSLSTGTDQIQHGAALVEKQERAVSSGPQVARACE